MRVQLIGFGPFPGARVNPSASLVKALARRRRPAFAVIERTTYILLTAYAAVDCGLPTLFAQNPDVVLMFGVAGRRRGLCIETRARNAVTLLSPDVGGYRPQRGAIVPGGQATLSGKAPLAYLLAAARTSGFPAQFSRDAGRYVCNYAYWRALERTGDDGPLVQFVHIPAFRSKARPGQRPATASFDLLVIAAERLLVALIAARRRSAGR